MFIHKNTNQILESLKQVLEEGLKERKYTLPMPPDEGMQGKELETVIPKVVIGNIPHENFGIYALDSRYTQAPYVLIGIKDTVHNYTEKKWNLLIQTCCYATAGYSTGDKNRFPDNLAFMDCNNLLETLEEILIESDIPVTMPIEIGDYSQKAHTYPLAYGYLECDIEINEPFENRKFEDY